jgi:hypothetical protein
VTRPRSPLAPINAILEQIVVVMAGNPVIPSNNAHVVLARIKENWAAGDWIDLRSGYAFDRFMQRIGVQDGLYMSQQELRRDLWDLVEVGMLEGDPQTEVRWMAEED